MGKRLGVLLLALPLSVAGIIPRTGVSAGTAYPGRATLSGAVYLGGDSVTVESQRLTLHVGEVPAEGDVYDDCYMTSDLTFYNAGEADATLQLAYPCPALPAGVQGEYRLSLNEEEIVPKVCHTYAGYYNRKLDVDGMLEGEGAQDPGFYRPDLPVTKYVFRTDLTQNTLTEAEKKHLALVVTLDCDPATTRIVSSNTMNYEVVNGRLRLAFELKGGEERTEFVAAGRDVANVGYAVYSDLARTERVPAHIISMKASTTFDDYARSFYPEGCEVSEQDWACGLAQMLATSTAGGCVAYGRPCNLRPEAFLKWYVYSVTIPAGTRAVHTVSAPLYPATANERYQYDILLSPLACWSVPDFRVSLETPYYLAYSSLEFEKEGEHYTFSRNCLPLGELSFTLRESAEEVVQTGGHPSISPSYRLAFILLGVLGGGAVIGGAVAIVAVRKKKRRNRP